MSTKVGVGVSINRDPKKAGFEAAEKALKNASIEKADFVFMFSTVGYPQEELLKSVNQVIKDTPLIGCSGEGVIAPGEAIESNFSVVVSVIKSDEFFFKNGISENLQKDPISAGKTISNNINENPIGLFIFPDFTVNFDKLLIGIEENLQNKKTIPIWGAVAGDNFAFKKTYQYYNDKVLSEGVSWAILYGKTEIAAAVIHGCIPIGSKRYITKCKENIIYEIDNIPADQVMSEYLSEETVKNWDTSQVLGELCPGFKVENRQSGQEEFYIRAILGGRDKETGAIIIPTEIKEGTPIWMTRRDKDKIVKSFDVIAERINNQLNLKTAKLIFHFECAGRGKIILREQQKINSLKNLQSKINNKIPWIGFYSYGEIAPVGNKNCFHNFTSIVIALY